MPKKFRIEVFGKPGCAKCALLNKRLDQMLAENRWKDFEKCYHNVETVDGLVAFAQTECMNPSRIPGFVIRVWNEERQTYDFVAQKSEPVQQGKKPNNFLSVYLGVETDYSEDGKGLLSPNLIQAVLQTAVDDGRS